MTEESLRYQYKELLVKNATLKLEIERRQKTIDKLKNDVIGYQQELERAYLEKKWLVGDDDNRIKPKPEIDAENICKQISDHHRDISEDVFQALRQKKSQLDAELFELQREFQSLKGAG